jgi:hypothetical protein
MQLRSLEIDAHVLELTFDAVGGDGAWENVFEAIPGFFGSEMVNVIQEHLSDTFRTKFSQALSGFWTTHSHLAWSPNHSEVINSLCASMLPMQHSVLMVSLVSHILLDIRNRCWPELLQSNEMGHSLRRWGDSNGLACLSLAWLGDFLLRLGLGLRYPRLTWSLALALL